MAFSAVRTMPCCIVLLIQTTSATVERDAFYGPADAAYPGGHEPRSQRLHDEGAAGSGNGRDEVDRWHEDVGIISQSNFSDVLRRFALTSRGELLSFATDGPMSGTLPTELGQLAGIRHIMLGGHLISGTLPTELARLTSLESIDLSSNALSGTLPSEMARLSRVPPRGSGYQQPVRERKQRRGDAPHPHCDCKVPVKYGSNSADDRSRPLIYGRYERPYLSPFPPRTHERESDQTPHRLHARYCAQDWLSTGSTTPQYGLVWRPAAACAPRPSSRPSSRNW